MAPPSHVVRLASIRVTRVDQFVGDRRCVLIATDPRQAEVMGNAVLNQPGAQPARDAKMPAEDGVRHQTAEGACPMPEVIRVGAEGAAAFHNVHSRADMQVAANEADCAPMLADGQHGTQQCVTLPTHQVVGPVVADIGEVLEAEMIRWPPSPNKTAPARSTNARR